jgi:hypothetical protein
VLNEIREFPVPLKILQEILDQRQSENAAYERYRIARQELFHAARQVGF